MQARNSKIVTEDKRILVQIKYTENHGQNREVSTCKKQKQMYRKKTRLKDGKIEYKVQRKKHENN